MNNRLLALLLLAPALAACDGAASTAQPPLAGAQLGGPFELVSEDGKPVTDRDFAGKYRLMYFGYSYCPDVCPLDLQRLMAGYKLFEQRDPAAAARVQPLFVSIDPARDTPAVLKQYTDAFHPRLIGLTGSEAQIAEVAKANAIFYGKAQGGGATDYLMDHSNQAYLFGPKGEPIALVPQDGAPEAIADELQRWVK